MSKTIMSGCAKDDYFFCLVVRCIGGNILLALPRHSQHKGPGTGWDQCGVESMSKVTRWSRGFDGGMTKDPFGDWVLAGDAAHRQTTASMALNAAQAELSALREELAVAKQEIESRIGNEVSAIEALTAAEQRNAEHESMLRHFASCADVRQVGTLAMGYVAALLKPTESGASE